MNDLFAPPDNDWQPVSPSLGRMRHLEVCVGVAVLAALVVLLGLLVGFPVWLWVVATVVLLGLVAWGWRIVTRNTRSWGYAERDEDLYVKHGATFRKLVVVPYGRMQFVDVNAGPLELAFGIATVHLHTASPGTSARIPGLPKAEAARLRDRLTSLGESQAAGL